MEAVQDEVQPLAAGDSAPEFRSEASSADGPFHTFRGLLVGLSLGLVFWGVAVLVWWML